MQVKIEEMVEFEPDVVIALRRMILQLSRSSSSPDERRLRRVIESPAVELLVARDRRGDIVGTLSLVMIPLLTGLRARIEDFVVDESARGQGVGGALVTEALRRARTVGARDIDLTSRRERTAAARVYQAAGFERRETDVYRHRFDQT